MRHKTFMRRFFLDLYRAKFGLRRFQFIAYWRIKLRLPAPKGHK